MQAGMRWLSEQTRKGRIQLRPYMGGNGGGRKGRGLGRGSAMLCATLAIIIVGAVFGLNVMDASVDGPPIRQSTDWQQAVNGASQGSSKSVRPNKMLLTGPGSVEPNVMLAGNPAKQNAASGLSQSQAGSVQKQAEKAFVGLWQHDQPSTAGGLGAQAQQNASTNVLPGKQLPSTARQGLAGNTSLTGNATSSKPVRDTTGFYKADFGAGGDLRANEGSGGSALGSGLGSGRTQNATAATAKGSKTADSWSSLLDDPADSTNMQHASLANASSLSSSSAALPLTDQAASDRQTIQAAQKGELTKTLPGLGSVLRQPADSLAATKKSEGAALLTGKGTAAQQVLNLTGTSTGAQTVNIIDSSTGSAAGASSSNTTSSSASATKGSSSSGSETKTGAKTVARAGSGRTARQDAQRLLISLQQSVKLSETAQRRLAPPTLQLQKVLANAALSDNAPEIRQATVALAKLITMDAELSAAASGKATASDTRTGAGKATDTRTDNTASPSLPLADQLPVKAASGSQLGDATGVSLGGVATTAEAEALAEAARQSGKFVLEPVTAARDAAAYKAAEASDTAAASSGTAAADLAAAVKEEEQGAALGGAKTAEDPQVAATNAILDDSRQADPQPSVLGSGESALDSLVTGSEVASDTPPQNEALLSALASGNKALEPLVTSADSSAAAALEPLTTSADSATSSDALAEAGQESAAIGGLPSDWDWKTYLTLNPDVASIMGNNQIAAEGHWRMYGSLEHRQYKVADGADSAGVAVGALDTLPTEDLQEAKLESDTADAANTVRTGLSQDELSAFRRQ